jgi:serine/threonine protein phosphatase PrpC
MGIYLSSPDTRKHSVDGEGNGTKYGASCMQGWRLNMEDAHISEAKFDTNASLFAIFDGHGGCEVAKFCGKYFGPELKKNSHYIGGRYKEALEETFLKMDVMLLDPKYSDEIRSLKNEEGGESFAGCTATVTLIMKGVVWTANAGDSRAILWSNKKVKALSEDHKPDNEIEKTRISKAGGFIIEGRVNGNLNLSRALGDLEYKKNASLKPAEQLISPFPDVTCHEIKPEDKFLVMGCDGIWELLTMDEICQIAETSLANNPSCVLAADQILDRGLAPDTSNGTGCDNMSCIVIQLNMNC